MSRCQRVNDNWALLNAQQEALERKVPLLVVFCLLPQYQGAVWRHYYFMIQGLRETESALRARGIGFHLLPGDPADLLPEWLQHIEATSLYCDFDPLRPKQQWLKNLLSRVSIPVTETDSSNIIPVWLVSSRQEYGAYTLRPKIHRMLDSYLCALPDLAHHPYALTRKRQSVDWDRLVQGLEVDRSISPVYQIIPGETAARQCLDRFLREGLSTYHLYSNDPTRDNTSRLSAYLHFGQISSQRIALAVRDADTQPEAKAAFLEQLIVRRELSDNFCFYNNSYDQVEGFPEWAQQTLSEHHSDPRPFLYQREALEQARTHDPLWNAAQNQMLREGYMHGYMRMYWAKKILEWSPSPQIALQNAIWLNDRYQLDGRDPNGYTGIAWSIGGVHDRAWPSHPVFGKIRIMTDSGARRKFSTEKYIRQFLE